MHPAHKIRYSLISAALHFKNIIALLPDIVLHVRLQMLHMAELALFGIDLLSLLALLLQILRAKRIYELFRCIRRNNDVEVHDVTVALCHIGIEN